MKRTLLATLLGIAASVASSYGAGSFYFSTYLATPAILDGPVHWSMNSASAPPGMAGQIVVGGSNIVADLVYSYTSYGGSPATVDTGLATPLQVEPVRGDGWINYATPIILPSTYPNSEGPGPAVTMTINLSGNYLGTPVTGSVTWTEYEFTAAPGQYFSDYPGQLRASLIPEPGEVSLLGLSAGSLLIFRKRK
jgi:hypothetical protein